MLHSIGQQIWKTQQWSQDWKRSVFIPVPKKGTTKECSNYCTIALISHASIEKALAPHSSTLAWRISWTEEPGGLKSTESQRVGHNWVTSLLLFTFMHWRRKWQPTPVFLPGESQGQRSLVGCCLWGHTESDTTEGLHFHFSLSCIGERNDNPLQCSCLENPRDRGAWWAAIYGVVPSQTWLKWLSSSSSSSSTC